jgi:hypothetical protein
MRTLRIKSLCVAGVLAALGCAAAPAGALLGSASNPVRADSYLGELEYLSRLRCPDGTQPHAQRVRPRKPGPYGHRVIGYRVRCIYLNVEQTIYIDELHPAQVELEPVPGFAVAGAPDRRRLFWLER